MSRSRPVSRRRFLGQVAAGFAAPMVVSSTAFGANDKLAMGCVGLGGQGTGDMNGFLGFKELRVVAICDVIEAHRQRAKDRVDKRYGDSGCVAVVDYRDVVTRRDIDLVLIATPDHWHAQVAIDAMAHGKDVYCEKPESLTIREGRLMVETARALSRRGETATKLIMRKPGDREQPGIFFCQSSWTPGLLMKNWHGSIQSRFG